MWNTLTRLTLGWGTTGPADRRAGMGEYGKEGWRENLEPFDDSLD